MINEKEYKLLKEAKIEKYEKYKKASDYFKANIKKFNQSMLDDLPTESEEKEMLKINQEEYVILKEALNEGYEWITRDKHNLLCKHRHKPLKNNHWTQEYWGNIGNRYKGIDDNLLQFIQWEDEEPWSVQELIKEYESRPIETTPWTPNPLDFEGEEKEVKNIEWLKSWFEDDELYWGEYVKHKIDQLDEPEVLSQELPVVPRFVADWIEGNKQFEEKWNDYSKEEAMNDTIHFTIYGLFADYPATNSHVELRKPVLNWLIVDRGNYFKLVNSVRYGYEVEAEQKYFARIKGHENISSDDKYWNYCITDESLDIGDNKVHVDVLAEYMLSATKDEWENLGINDDNADFIEVGELEE